MAFMPPSQRRIGLTGGIASGKSSVGALLAQRGLTVLDADRFAREALAAGSPAARSVLERYGPQVAGPKGATPGGAAIDRAALGRIVFSNAGERRWLEQLVHPVVRERFQQGLRQHAAEPTLVLMIPLLHETGLEPLCTEVWLVNCEESQQLQRLIGRDGLTEAEAIARIRAQWPLQRKRQLADRIIDNRGSPEALAAQVDAALDAAMAMGPGFSPGASG